LAERASLIGAAAQRGVAAGGPIDGIIAGGGTRFALPIWKGFDGMSGTHIAALFDTTAAARAAEASLVAAGVDHSRILVLDRGHKDAPSPHHIWSVLKHVLLPDDDAHDYAEGVGRGHPLLVADVTEAEQAAALAALEGAHPLNIEQRAQEWREGGWDGIYDAGRHALALDDEFEGAESSEGELPHADLLTGDYGSVGAPLDRPQDLSILRGKRFPGGDSTAVRTDEGDRVRVYSVE
jgi:hypothetical protein